MPSGHSTQSDSRFSGYGSVEEHLLHTMHDAVTFADGTTKAILEGVLHHYEYGRRERPHRGSKCPCPHCVDERRWDFGQNDASPRNKETS